MTLGREHKFSCWFSSVFVRQIGPQVSASVKAVLDAYRDEVVLRSDPFTRAHYRPGMLTNFE